MDQTCYFFDVSPAHLEPALDRFAQFFISPLFDPSCTEREANAVNSENSKNLHSDMWRWFQLDKSSSSRKHSYWRFGTGNKETLWDEPMRQGIDVRERLIQWQQKHYSANLMKLVVVTKGEIIAEWVVATICSCLCAQIRSTRSPRLSWKNSLRHRTKASRLQNSRVRPTPRTSCR